MHHTLRNILPVLALTLGACQLSTKNLGDPNVDSDSGVATEGKTSTGTESATGPLTGGITSTGADTDQATTSGTSGASEGGPETTVHSHGTSSGDETATEGVSTSTGLLSSTGGPGLCEEAPLDAPGVERTCQIADDCAVVFHQTDCCGTLAAFAVNVESLAAYSDAEAPCMFEPNCDCAPEATVAEDGDATADNASIVAVCVDNECRSEVPGP